MANPVPEGTHTLTPHLVVKGGAKAIAFYQRALGAQETLRMPGPGGSVAHAELRLGDSLFYLADAFPGSPLQPPGKSASVSLHVYVADCDALFQRALSAGAQVVMPLMDMFWGDRYGQLRDPFGHVWSIATHKEDLSPEQMAQRGAEAMANMPAPKPKKSARRKAKAAPRKKTARRRTARRKKASRMKK